MKNYLFCLILLVTGASCVASASEQQSGRSEFLAAMFGKYINNKSFAALYSDLNKSLQKDAISFLKADLIKNNAIISSKVNGSEVTVNSTLTIQFQDDGSVQFNKNKQKFAYDETKSFKENYEFVRSLLGVQSGLFNLVIPHANAFFEPITTAFTIVSAAAVVVVGTVVLVGNEIVQAYKDGSVICEGESFVFRAKHRNAIKWASTDSIYLKPLDASKILNEKVEKCNDSTAKKLGMTIGKNLEVKDSQAKAEVEKAKRNLEEVKNRKKTIEDIQSTK